MRLMRLIFAYFFFTKRLVNKISTEIMHLQCFTFHFSLNYNFPIVRV